MSMYRRSLYRAKGREDGPRRRYALMESASAVAVGISAGWRRQRRR